MSAPTSQANHVSDAHFDIYAGIKAPVTSFEHSIWSVLSTCTDIGCVVKIQLTNWSEATIRNIILNMLIVWSYFMYCNEYLQNLTIFLVAEMHTHLFNAFGLLTNENENVTVVSTVEKPVKSFVIVNIFTSPGNTLP